MWSTHKDMVVVCYGFMGCGIVERCFIDGDFQFLKFLDKFLTSFLVNGASKGTEKFYI